jgi:hypothetical protein
MADVNVQCALVQLHLGRVVCNVRQRQAAFRTDSQNARAEIQFRARVLISPDIVSIRERAVYGALDPIVSSVRLNGN